MRIAELKRKTSAFKPIALVIENAKELRFLYGLSDLVTSAAKNRAAYFTKAIDDKFYDILKKCMEKYDESF